MRVRLLTALAMVVLAGCEVPVQDAQQNNSVEGQDTAGAAPGDHPAEVGAVSGNQPAEAGAESGGTAGAVGIAPGDVDPPTTSDDVPGEVQPAPVTVTLTASDEDGSGVDKTYYSVGESPA